MKMFILGAISFYIITSLIGFILDQLDILDYLTFGEFYTQLIPSLVIIPFIYIKKVFMTIGIITN